MTDRKRQPPSQERSRLTEQALIDAALRLFRARGMDAVTTTDIALAAGVSPATVNRRFGDRAGLERQAFQSFIDRALTLVRSFEAATKAPGLVDLLAQISAVVLGFSLANQGFLQSAYARALVDDDYAVGLRELRSSVFALLRSHLVGHADEMAHPEPVLAVDFVLQQAMAMLSARIDAARLEVGGLDDGIFYRELMRSLLGYLQVECSLRQIDQALAAWGLQGATHTLRPPESAA